MKILVTGATGFLGNYVVNELLKTGHAVIATSKDVRKAETMKWFKKIKYVPLDISTDLFSEKENDLFSLFHRPDLLIHLAWEGLPSYQNLVHVEKNLFNQFFFLRKLIAAGLSDITVLGTCFEYGLQEGELTENCVVKPATTYGLAKNILRELLEEFEKKYHFYFKWIRLFYVYAEEQQEKGIIGKLNRALKNEEKVFSMSGGEQLRDYLPIETAAKYIGKIAAQKKINGIINCCSGEPISLRRFVENYLSRKRKSIKINYFRHPYLPYEPMAFWGDNAKLRKILKSDL